MTTNKIEEALLNRELKNITDQLQKVGNDIVAIFDRYGVIKGNHKKELHYYLVEHVLNVAEPYYAGYTTTPSVNTHPAHIPECIKKLVLDWAVADFMQKLDNIENVISEVS